MSEGTKQCPFCGETINLDAKKCKYCKQWLDDIKKEEINNKSINFIEHDGCRKMGNNIVNFFKTVLFITAIVGIYYGFDFCSSTVPKYGYFNNTEATLLVSNAVYFLSGLIGTCTCFVVITMILCHSHSYKKDSKDKI